MRMRLGKRERHKNEMRPTGTTRQQDENNMRMR